jgi:spermidine synthase
MSSAPNRALPILVLLCVASGCAALIYQVVWFQLLGLVIGASSASLGLLLGAFMGGMCLGSLLLPRLVRVARHPLRVFGLTELGIGAFGLVILYGMPAVAGFYTAWAGPGSFGLALRAAVAGLCLLPPTILMGATLPAIARWLETTPHGTSRLGYLYGANIGGAVLGCLLAASYLLRVHDVAVATFTAVGLNALVACASLGLAAKLGYASVRSEAPEPTFAAASWPIHVAIALSGMTALAAEVIWTRHLSLLFGGTVYTFALLLGVFLFGLGAGSAAGSALSRRVPARAALGGCQLLLCAAIAWAASTVSRFLPYWPLDVTLPAPAWVTLQLDLVRAAWAILPAALLWGASFPLALAAAAPGGRDPARLTGGVYAANTIGAIAGALGASFVLVPWLGSQLAQQVLIVVAACSGLLALSPIGSRAYKSHPAESMRRSAATAAAVAGAIALAASVPSLPREFVAFGRFTPTRGIGAEVVYVGEGLTSTVAVSAENGILTYHNAGKPQASTYPQDMRLQRMLGHLTTLVAEDPRSFLVIGLGSGMTAGAVSLDPAAERVVVAEIEPLVSDAVAAYFRAENFGVIDDPKVELLIDDGRHYLATTDEKFDGITSDPLDPWVRGAAALYTREFWELVESRLNPGGVVTVFVQFYETTEEAVKSEVATFFEVFPNGALFANTVQSMGYDGVLLARANGAPIDVDLIHERLTSPEYARVADSLERVGFGSAVDLLGTYAGQASALAEWSRGAPINTDRNLRLQYLAGQGLNLYTADVIYSNLLAAGPSFSADVFVGSAGRLEQLRRAIRARSGGY